MRAGRRGRGFFFGVSHASAPGAGYGGCMEETGADVHFLGFIAFCRMTCYARLARDVSMTQNFNDQLALARMGGAYVGAIDDLLERAHSGGLEVGAATQDYVGLFDDLEARTRPGDWYERLVKSYVMVGILRDLELYLADLLSAEARQSLGQVDAIGHEEWVVKRLGATLTSDRMLQARLSMWGRRVGGEVLAQSQQILGARPALLPAGYNPAGLMEHLTQGHTRRMSALGLSA